MPSTSADRAGWVFLCPATRHSHVLKLDTFARSNLKRQVKAAVGAGVIQDQEALERRRARCVPDGGSSARWFAAVSDSPKSCGDRLVPVAGGVLVNQRGARA